MPWLSEGLDVSTVGALDAIKFLTRCDIFL